MCTDAGKPVPFQEKDVSVNAARKPSADKTFAARLEPGKDKEKDREAKEKEREKPKEPPAPVNCLHKKQKLLRIWNTIANVPMRDFGLLSAQALKEER